MATTKTVEIEVKAKDSASKTFNGIGESISKNLNKIKIASGAVSAGLVALGKKFLDASIENEPLQKSFERLSESAGIASKDMINAMRKASQGTVADTQLMASANKAYALGIVKSADDMATMIEVARLKGQAMGRTMEEALDDITTGLGRGSAQILDNLGIVVNAEEVNEKYAQSIGKTVKELTDEEKKQALVNAVIAQGKEELANVGEVQLTMQEKIARLNASWENTKNVIGDALIPVLDKLLTKLTPIIEKVVAWIEENPELTSNIILVAGAVSGLVFACSTLIPAITTIVGLLSGPLGWISLCGMLVAGLYTLDGKLKTTDEQIEGYQEELYNLTVAYNEGKIPLEEYLGKTEELNNKIEEARAKHETFTGYLQDNFISTLHSLMHPMDENNGGLRAWIDLLEMAGAWINSVAKTIKSVLVVALDTVISKMKDLRDWAVKVANKISEFAGGAISSASSWVKSKLSGFANGGSVQGNVPIIVGERGPEVFVPSSNGTIIPNEQIAGSTINVNISGVSVRNDNDIKSLAQEMIRQIKLEKNFGIA